jgi:hypothetical protein
MVSSPTVDTNGGFNSMDAIVGPNSTDKGNASKPLITTQSPVSDAFKSTPDMETISNGRPSMDTLSVPTQGFAPNNSQPPTGTWNFPSLKGVKSSHSRSTTVDMSASAGKSVLPSHSRSTTIDMGTSRSPLDGVASTDLMSNQAKPPIQIADKVNTWDSWGLGLLDDSNKPVKPREDRLFASQTPPPPTTSIGILKETASPKKPRPMSLPVPPRPQTDAESPQDDEMVANILRDLPDLSYMLR